MYKVVGNKKEYNIFYQDDKLVIDGHVITTDIQKLGLHRWLVRKDNKCFTVDLVEVDKDQRLYSLLVNGNKYELHVKDPLELIIDQLGMNNIIIEKTGKLNAPMPGLVLEIMVKPGDIIKKGDALIILEAMKMENILKADHDGIISEILVAKGDSVEKNQVLIRF